MAGSSSMAFLPCPPCVRDILSLLAWLHAYPLIGLCCILEIEILFNHLSLQLSDFQSSPKNLPSCLSSIVVQKTAVDEEPPVTRKELAVPPKADTEKSPLLKREKE